MQTQPVSTDNSSLSGRVAIVTGGTRGIGLACARGLAACGATVVVAGTSGGDSAVKQRVVAALDGAGDCQSLDVTDVTSIDSLVQRTRDQHGDVGVLVNAAGIYQLEPVASHSDELWEATMTVNLSGTFRMIRAVLPDMQHHQWGRIVNIASTSARIGSIGHAAYCASKAGVVGLTRCVAAEGAAHGINCVSVSPTWVETDMLHDSAQRLARASGQSVDKVVAEITSSNPQQRLVQPEEVAELVSYLCSDAARAVTGEDIQINAGAAY